MSALSDLVKLSQRTGKIPSSVPDHYVKWALSTHRKEKKRKEKKRKEKKREEKKIKK